MFFIHLKCGRKFIMENNSCNMRKGLLCGMPVYPFCCFSREDAFPLTFLYTHQEMSATFLSSFLGLIASNRK